MSTKATWKRGGHPIGITRMRRGGSPKHGYQTYVVNVPTGIAEALIASGRQDVLFQVVPVEDGILYRFVDEPTDEQPKWMST